MRTTCTYQAFSLSMAFSSNGEKQNNFIPKEMKARVSAMRLNFFFFFVARFNYKRKAVFLEKLYVVLMRISIILDQHK